MAPVSWNAAIVSAKFVWGSGHMYPSPVQLCRCRAIRASVVTRPETVFDQQKEARKGGRKAGAIGYWEEKQVATVPTMISALYFKLMTMVTGVAH